MSRNLKALGLALVATLALGAFGATAAYAEDEGRVVLDESTEGHLGQNDRATIRGTDVGETNHLELTAFGDPLLACDENLLHGEVEGGTHTELTLEATFGGPAATQKCTALSLPTTVHSNGCHLRFNTFETTTEETWKGTTDLICDGPGLVMTVFAGGAHGFRVCTVTIPEQEGIERFVVHNNVNTTVGHPEAHDITLTAEAEEITAHRSGLCGSASTAEAEIHGELTLAAENEDEQPIDIYVEHHE